MDLATIGFKSDTSGLTKAERDLDSLTRTGSRTEGKVTGSMGAISMSFMRVASSIVAVTGATLGLASGLQTVSQFEDSMLGLQATIRGTEEEMARLEKQARDLGATTVFAASEAAQAQRYLAQAGLDVNEVLAATPGILQLAVAGQMDLAESADLASNILGAMRLPVSELARVNDVLAEAAAMSNTNVQQLGQALSYAAPIAATAGIEIEEVSAAIGVLSDSGLQASRAGTGLLGIIRQLSKVTPQAADALAQYGLSAEDVNVETMGLTSVMETLRRANISTADSFVIFGSEAGPAAQILAAGADTIGRYTTRLQGAEGAAEDMANTIGSGLSATMKSFSSAVSEATIQLGTDSGLAGGLQDVINTATGVISVYNGMLPGFAESNDLTEEQTQGLNDMASTLSTVAELVAVALGARMVGAIAASATAMAAAQMQAIRYQGALATMAGLSYRVAAAQTAQAAATRLAAGSMALLGGPAGLVALAAYGVYRFVDANYKSADAVNKNNQAISESVDFMEVYIDKQNQVIAETVRGMSSSEMQERFDTLSSLLGPMEERLARLGDTVGVNTARYQQYAERVRKLQEEKRLILDIMPEMTTSEEQQSEALSKVTLALTDQIYELTHGKEAYELLIAARQAGVDIDSKEARGIKALIAERNKLRKALNKDVDTYGELLGMFDDQQAAHNIYYDQVKKIIDAGLEEAETTELIELAYKKLQEQLESLDREGNTDNQAESLQNLIDKVYGLNDAWSQTGSTVVDAFGNMADVLNNYNNELTKITRMEEELGKEKEKYREDSDYYKEITKAEEELADRRTSANLSSFASIAGAASQMFDEQSKGREALYKMEQVLTAAEIAMSLQKAGANALEAITSAFAAPWPINFASGAAMIAIMAGLGVFSGGGGNAVDMTEQRQASQGTGTLLGSDEKSASIYDSADRLEDIQVDQLAELRGIRNNIRSLSSGIQQLATSVVAGVRFDSQAWSGQLGEQNTGFTASIGSFLEDLDFLGGDLLGGIVGSFSKTKKSLLDSGITFFSQTLGEILESGEVEAAVYADIKTKKSSWWGLSSSSSMSTEYEDLDSAITSQMADIFGHIGDSVIEAANLLGFQTVTVTQTAFQNLLTGRDLADIGGNLYDWINRWGGNLFSQITTTTEMSLEDALADFQIDLTNVSLEGLNGEEIQAELEAVFSQQADLIAEYLVPSISQYQQIGEGAYETLIRVAQEQAIFNDHMERTGVVLSQLSNEQLIGVSQAVIQLMGGLEEFQDATNEYFDAFFSEQEKFEYLEKSITDVMNQLNLTLPTTHEEFRNIVEGLDLTTEEGRMMYATLMELVPAMAEYLDQLEDQGTALEKLQGVASEALTALEASINAEKERLAAQLTAAQEAYNNTLELIANEKTKQEYILSLAEQIHEQRVLMIENEISLMDEAIANSDYLLSRVRDSIDAQQEAINSQAEAQVEYLTQEQEFEKQLLDQKLADIDAQVLAEQELHQGRMESIQEQLSLTQTSISQLKTLANTLSNSYDSIGKALGAQGAFAQLDEAISQLKSGNFDIDISEAMRFFTSGNSTYASATDAKRDNIQAQIRLKELGQLTDTQLTIEEKMLASLESTELNETTRNERLLESLQQQREEAQAGYDETISKLDEEIAAIQESAEAQIQALDDLYTTQENQLLELQGIDTSVDSVAEAVAKFQQSLIDADFTNYQEELNRLELIRIAAQDELSAAQEFYNSQLGILDTQTETAAEILAQAQEAYDANIDRLDQILEYYTEELNTLLGIDTSVKSVGTAITDLQQAMEDIGFSGQMMEYSEKNTQAIYALAQLNKNIGFSNAGRIIASQEAELAKLTAANEAYQDLSTQKLLDEYNKQTGIVIDSNSLLANLVTQFQAGLLDYGEFDLDTDRVVGTLMGKSSWIVNTLHHVNGTLAKRLDTNTQVIRNARVAIIAHLANIQKIQHHVNGQQKDKLDINTQVIRNARVAINQHLGGKLNQIISALEEGETSTNPSGQNSGQQLSELRREMAELRKDNKTLLSSVAKHTSESNSVLKRIELNGLETYTP